MSLITQDVLERRELEGGRERGGRDGEGRGAGEGGGASRGQGGGWEGGGVNTKVGMQVWNGVVVS